MKRINRKQEAEVITKFDASDTPFLKSLLRLMGDPARRHRCPCCKDVFECHLCTIYAEHPLHWEICKMPLMCISCWELSGMESIAVMADEHEGGYLGIYDYTTGTLIGRYRGVRGTNSGRSNGIWAWNERLFTGVRNSWIQFEAKHGPRRERRYLSTKEHDNDLGGR